MAGTEKDTIKVVDLFCGAGGASKGYANAGFTVTGVDIEPQSNYPYDFIQADALTFDVSGYDIIHASPPCQAYSNLNAYNHQEYPDLIHPIREILRSSGKPYVIENVTQAPLIEPVILCGVMFDLRLYRHRGFESNLDLKEPAHYAHDWLCSRNGYLPTVERPFMSIHGGKHSIPWLWKACEYMGTPWMRTIREVCESIPPAYTHEIGRQLW